jgi:hypothetical protein
MPTIQVSDANYDWLQDQKQPKENKQYESMNDVLDRMRKERGKD